MRIPSQKELELKRHMYPAGTRVELISFVEADPYSTLKPGDCGTVQWVDDACNLIMSWDNGSTLNLLSEDHYIRIKEAIS